VKCQRSLDPFVEDECGQPCGALDERSAIHGDEDIAPGRRRAEFCNDSRGGSGDDEQPGASAISAADARSRARVSDR
jgi:hypothetical protein